MDKKYFALYLIPLRGDFTQTMSEEERLIMTKHVDHWTEHINRGRVIVFGPVLDPKGVYGLGVVSAHDEQEVKDIIANDPAGNINKYEYVPIKAVVRQTKTS